MRAAELVERLERVRRTGEGRWIASCPAHGDRSPSLSVREADDGRILVHCFSGCAVEQIMTALGLELVDLFPERRTRAARSRPSFDAGDVLRALVDELDVILIVLGDLKRRRTVASMDFERFDLAIERVRAARDLACG